MARPAKIWWNSGKGKYYCTINGVKTPLAADREEAERLFHRHKSREKAPDLGNSNTCETIIGLYLEYLKQHHPASYRCAKQRLDSFLLRHPGVRVRELRATHVFQWINGHATWNDNTRHLAVSWLVAALSWAAKPQHGYIAANPIRGIERPQASSRGKDAVISETDRKALYGASHASLQDVLLFLEQTGTRPGNLCKITAAECDFANSVVTLPEHKTAGKTGRPLHILLTPPAVMLLRRLCALYTHGPLFRTRHGIPWSTNTIGNAVRGAARRAGIEKRVFPYGYRHTMATELLRKGMPEAHVAQVLGHSNPTMLRVHYGHLDCYHGETAAAVDKLINQAPAAKPADAVLPTPPKTEGPIAKSSNVIADAWDEYFDDE